MTLPAGGDDAAALQQRFDLTTLVVDVNGEPLTLTRPRDVEALIDEDEFNRDERLPYWADIWPSSVALARAVSGMKGDGRALLELGCGLGLASAAALRAGFDVTASDYYDDALAFARMNGLANTGREPRTMILDWRHLPAAIRAFDLVIAADVLYERPLGTLVATAIATTLAEGGRALVADPGRVGSHAFFDELRNVGLRHVGATTVTVSLNGHDHSIMLHDVTR